MSPRAAIRYLRDWFFGITQTEARERLKRAIGPVLPPKPIAGYETSDGREVMRRKVRTIREWSQTYDDRRQVK